MEVCQPWRTSWASMLPTALGRCGVVCVDNMLDAVFLGSFLRRDSKDANLECLLRLQAWRSYTVTVFLRFFCVYYCTCWIKETQPQNVAKFFRALLHPFLSASVSEAPHSTSGTRCISMMRCHRSAGVNHTIINYTWIFQLCKICAFSPQKPTKRQTFYIFGRSRYILGHLPPSNDVIMGQDMT